MYELLSREDLSVMYPRTCTSRVEQNIKRIYCATMLKQPQGVKLLTNISVVRLVKGDKKFEIACYPNTVTAWRQGVFAS